MTEQEQADLVILVETIRKKKIECYNYMESLNRADARQLLHSGYNGKTNAEAMQLAFQMFQRDIQKLQNAHVRKYPD